MPNTYFQFKEFRVEQEKSGMKVTTDGCLFGAWVADEIKKLDTEPKRILDIGTGTGLLSLMVAQVTARSKITGVDINQYAYQEATRNFKNSSWSKRLKSLHCPVQEVDEAKFNCIICNPPFFKNSQVGGNANRNQAIHAPGLSMPELLGSVTQLLERDGVLFLLYPEKEMEEFIALAKANHLYPHQIVSVRNQQGQPVFRTMCSFSIEQAELIHREIVIRNADRKYTTESWKLWKDYYLDYNDPTHPIT